LGVSTVIDTSIYRTSTLELKEVRRLRNDLVDLEGHPPHDFDASTSMLRLRARLRLYDFELLES
jgi:hypothetical protein